MLAIILCYSNQFTNFRDQLRENWVKIVTYCLQQICSSKNLVVSSVRLMAIFEEVSENEFVKREALLREVII